LDVVTASEATDEGNEKQHAADIGRDRSAREPEHVHGAKPAVPHGTAGAQRTSPEREREPLGGERLLHEIIVADRGAAGGDEDVRPDIACPAHRRCSLAEAIGHTAASGDPADLAL